MKTRTQWSALTVALLAMIFAFYREESRSSAASVVRIEPRPVTSGPTPTAAPTPPKSSRPRAPTQKQARVRQISEDLCTQIMNRIDTSEFRCLTYSIQGEFSPRLSEHEPGIETYAFVITLDPDRISPGSDEWEVEVEIEREDAGGERTLLLTRRLWVERAEDASEMQLHASHPEIRHVFLEAAGLDESFEGSLDVTTYLSEQSCLHPTDSEQHLKMEHGWTYSSYEGRVWVSEPFKAYVKVSSRTGGRHTNSCSF